MNKDLFLKAKAGDIDARNQIIEASVPVINRVCHKLWRANCDESSKRYGALLGIIHAINKFNPDLGNWDVYAYYCALGIAKREISKDYLVKFPTEIVNKRLRDGRSPCECVRFSDLFEQMGWMEYFYAEENGDEICSRVVGELMVNEDIPETECLKVLADCMNDLTEVEKDAIEHRFKYEPTTLMKLAEKHNVSHECIRMKADSGYKKLKTQFFKQLKQKETVWDTKSS